MEKTGTDTALQQDDTLPSGATPEMREAQKQVAATGAKLESATAGNEAAILAKNTQRDANQAQDAQDLADSPTRKKQTQPIHEFNQATVAMTFGLMIVSIAGSRSMKLGSLGAMSALNGALTGIMAGDEVAYQRDLNKYHAETKNIDAAFQEEQKKHNAVLANHKLTQNEKLQELNNLALIAGEKKKDTVKEHETAMKAKTKMFDDFKKRNEKLLDADKKRKEHIEDLSGASMKGEVQKIGDAIIEGKQPPTISGFGMAKIAAPLKAYLADKGFDLRQAELDYGAQKKFIASLNSTQQTRLRQAIGTTYESLDKIDQLAKQWKGYNFPILNSVNLIAAKHGVYGKEAASIATQLDGQITDVVSELGNVYMGGNSPTDKALVLAEKNLKGNWSESVLLDMTKLARANLKFRMNSMTNLGAAGMSGDKVPRGTGAVNTPEDAQAAGWKKIGKSKSTGKDVWRDGDGKPHTF